jgi:hypothetical protein
MLAQFLSFVGMVGQNFDLGGLVFTHRHTVTSGPRRVIMRTFSDLPFELRLRILRSNAETARARHQIREVLRAWIQRRPSHVSKSAYPGTVFPCFIPLGGVPQMYLSSTHYIAWDANPRLTNERSVAWNVPYGTTFHGADLTWSVRHSRGYPVGTMFHYDDGQDFDRAQQVPMEELRELYVM